ncbi:hypothetical protein QYF61_021630 [Mycteria americana]|uniref:Uncharacterized protein n=1 Tax=Mycteria americana TaxID=33587 RepID=A0AAN7MW25_MYCAM|nr:hypothetical protein QYF61_021630 [Mycteria americana]
MKVNQILGCIRRGITCRERDMIIPFYSALNRLHLEYCVRFWSLQFRKEVNRLQRVQRRATKRIKSLENLPHEERLKELEEKAQENLITVFQYLKGSYKEDGGSFFTRSHMEKTRGNRYKFHQERFHLDIRKKFFYCEINHWNNLPRDTFPETLPARVIFRNNTGFISMKHPRTSVAQPRSVGAHKPKARSFWEMRGACNANQHVQCKPVRTPLILREYKEYKSEDTSSRRGGREESERVDMYTRDTDDDTKRPTFASRNSKVRSHSYLVEHMEPTDPSRQGVPAAPLPWSRGGLSTLTTITIYTEEKRKPTQLKETSPCLHAH